MKATFVLLFVVISIIVNFCECSEYVGGEALTCAVVVGPDQLCPYYENGPSYEYVNGKCVLVQETGNVTIGGVCMSESQDPLLRCEKGVCDHNSKICQLVSGPGCEAPKNGNNTFRCAGSIDTENGICAAMEGFKCGYGDPCKYNSDCVSNVCVNSTCSALSDNETCQHDGDCKPDSFCQLPTLVCKPRAKIGENCTLSTTVASMHCVLDAHCVNDVCVEIGSQPAGSPCSHSDMFRHASVCEEGTWCNASSICEKIEKDDRNCSSVSDMGCPYQSCGCKSPDNSTKMICLSDLVDKGSLLNKKSTDLTKCLSKNKCDIGTMAVASKNSCAMKNCQKEVADYLCDFVCNSPKFDAFMNNNGDILFMESLGLNCKDLKFDESKCLVEKSELCVGYNPEPSGFNWWIALAVGAIVVLVVVVLIVAAIGGVVYYVVSRKKSGYKPI